MIMYFFTFINNDMYEMSCFHLIVILLENSSISHKFQIQSSKKLLMKLYINDNDSEMIPGKRSCVKIQISDLECCYHFLDA